MGYIVLLTDNDVIFKHYKGILDPKIYKFTSCYNATSIYDLLEIEKIDVVLLDTNIDSLKPISVIKKIRTKQPNTQILLLCDKQIAPEYLEYASGYITFDCPEELSVSIINSHLRMKDRLDNLSGKNDELAKSLYRLNVLYSTSSLFAGTLEIKDLLNYMIEGLDKSLSFDLTCTLAFEFEDEPVLIINSLYNLSEEIISALKLRSILNYKTLFENSELPFELNEQNLKVIKNIKNPTSKFTFNIFQYDSHFAPIDLGDKFFGCIEIFRQNQLTEDDLTYFNSIVKQVSVPLKSASLYKKILEKNDELRKLERVKSEFISIVSHELRTPLTPIKNALSILSGGRCGDLNPDGIKFLDMAKRNVNNLTNIITDILDINKIEAGKMDFNYKKIDIHSVIESVKTTFECMAKEQSINFTTSEQENLPQIYADSQRLGQVLTNLVSNAFKFTNQGKNITIKSELRNSKEIDIDENFCENKNLTDSDYIVVSVIDEGIGIKREDLLKTFEKFTQIENPLSRNVGGTGLGLAIAKQLIKAHKGIIWCESEENKGSSFIFAIPVIIDNIEDKTIQKELVGR